MATKKRKQTFLDNYGKQLGLGTTKDAIKWNQEQSLVNGKQNLAKKQNNSWFQSNAFDDGYDFGDITRSVLGTTADIGVNFLKGVSSTGENLGKLIVGGVAQVSDWIGQDEYADKLRNRLAGKDEDFNKGLETHLLTPALEKIDNKLDKFTLMGEKSDNIASGLGNIGSAAAMQSIGIPWYVTLGGSSAGAELENAYRSDATDMEAWASAGISGISEVLFEKLSGGIKFKNKTLDESIKKSLLSKISNRTIKNLSNYGIDMLGEGTEEVLTEIASNIGRKLTYENDKTWKEALASEESLNSYVDAFVSGAIVSGIANSKNIYNAVKNDKINKLQEQQLNDIEQRQLNVEIQYQNGVITEEQYNNEYNNILNELRIFTEENNLDKINPITEIEAKKQILDEQFDNQLISKKQYNKELNKLSDNLKNISNQSSLNFETNQENSTDLQSKTFEKNKDKKNVEFIPIEDILPYKSNGGYRTIEQINDLTNKIKVEGIENPIELIKNSDGSIEVYNGNHRLEIAKKLGINEIPVKFIKNPYIDNSKSNSYNEAKESYLEDDYGRNIGEFQKTSRHDVLSWNKQKNGSLYRSSSTERGRNQTYDKLHNKMAGYNNRSSINSTFLENGESQKIEIVNDDMIQEDNVGLQIPQHIKYDIDTIEMLKKNSESLPIVKDNILTEELSKQEKSNQVFDKNASQYTNANNNLNDLDSNYNNEKSKSNIEFDNNYFETKVADKKEKVRINKEVKNILEPLHKEMSVISEQINDIRNQLGIKNPNEISKLKKEDANTTPKLPIKKELLGNNQSSFYKNILEKTKMLDKNSRELIVSDKEVRYYQDVTNEESLSKAIKRLEENGKSETLAWFNKESKYADSTDVAEGWILMKQYEQAKDYDSMVQVAKKMRDIGTQAGQTVQAFNIMNRMTPEGMVKYAQSELSEAYDKMVKNKSKEWIDANKNKFDLTPNEVKFIMDNMEAVSAMEDGYQKKVKLAEIQKLMTDKLPPERGAGIKAWMRISMLFNPKTQVRNVLGNAIVTPVNIVGDKFASMVDKTISKKTGVRTTGTTSLKSYSKGMKEGIFQSYNDFKKGINTRNIEGNRFEITEGKSFENSTKIGKALNKVDNFLSFMLDAGDRGFYEASFTNSINNQLVLNNTDVVTQEMIDIATTEALQRTWQDSNNYTKFVLDIRKGLNKINFKGYGLGDVLIPFAKTPANLTKALIDYSPVGLINTINSGINLKNSFSNGQYNAKLQHKFVQNLGKATAGTLLYILGYALAKAGTISGESDDDKDVANFMKNTLGTSSYSIKIGDKSFTYDWAQPIAGPFSIMANLVQKNNTQKESNLLDNILSSLDTAGNLLLEQSFLDSINTVLSNKEGIVTGLTEAISELPSRSIPTFSKQLADMIDGTQRTTFEKNAPIETAKNKIISKIPFASKSLAPAVDTLGRDIKKYGGKNNVFNVFFNPANINSKNVSSSVKEIYQLYRATGDKSIMPRVVPYEINLKDGKRSLNSIERANYQKNTGNIVEQEMERLLENSNYNSLSYEEKAKVVSDIINYAYNKAQETMFGKTMASQYKSADKYVSNGGTIADYYFVNNLLKTHELNYEDQRELLNKNDKNYSIKVKELSNKKRKNIVDTIINLNVNKKAKAYLYGKYYGNEDSINCIVQSNIDFDEYLKFVSSEYTSDKTKSGKIVKNSRKRKVFEAAQKLNLTAVEKAMLIKTEYPSFDTYNYQIVNHINQLPLTIEDKKNILSSFGFKIKGGRIYW